MPTSSVAAVSAPGRWRDFDDDMLPPILAAALSCFVEHGYHGTTTRALAAAAGLSVPGLYHHYESKQAIIVDLMRRATDDLRRRSLAALAEATSVDERLSGHIECLVLFHAHRQTLAFVAANEIRSLQPAARARHIAARDRQRSILEEIIDAGVSSGDFAVGDVRGTARAVVTMCTGVAQWYRPESGAPAPDQIARQYTVIARRAVGSGGDPYDRSRRPLP